MASVSTDNGYNNRQAHNYYLGYEQALVKRRASPSMAIEGIMEAHTTSEHKQSYRRHEASRQYSFSFSFSFSLSFSFCLPFVSVLLLFLLQVAPDGKTCIAEITQIRRAPLLLQPGTCAFFGRLHGRGIIDRLGGARAIRVCRSKEPAEKGGRMWCNTASRRLTPKVSGEDVNG